MKGIEQLIGKTLIKIENNGDELVFHCADGVNFIMHHEQDCCEGVSIDDIAGDLDDLLNSPILEAEEVSDYDGPEGWKPGEYVESYTWTFYKLGTIKGHVTIRWYGESNGYYSESVQFHEVGKKYWEE